MGLLSEKAIRSYLASGELAINPPPQEEDFGSDSVDVHLGERVYTWKTPAGGGILTVPLWKAAEAESTFRYQPFSKENLVLVAPDPDGIITMRSQTFYLADLKQYTKLPNDLAMHIQGKSTLARLGLGVHLTAPHAHAGWKGRLTLEMYNSGPLNLELKPGIAIGQLTFWRVESPLDESKDGGFHGQVKATGETG